MHGAWSDLTLRYNYSFLAVTCSFLLTLFRGAMWIRRQNANIWKEKPSHWHHTVANIEKTHNLGSGFFYNFGFGLKSSHGFMHPVVFLVGSNLTDLASRGWTKVLICVVMYCKDSGFQACGAPGGGRLLECFFLVVEGLEASFRVRISLSFFHFWGLAWVEERIKESRVWRWIINRTQFGANRYWLIWICLWLTSMRIWIWRRNWRRWRCFGCEEIGFATLNRVCRCPSAGIWLLTTIAKTKSQQVAFVLLLLHVSFDAHPNYNFVLARKCQERDEHFYQIAALQCFGCDLRSCFKTSIAEMLKTIFRPTK